LGCQTKASAFFRESAPDGPAADLPKLAAMLSRARAIRPTVALSAVAAGRFVAAGIALRAAGFLAACFVVLRVFLDMIGPLAAAPLARLAGARNRHKRMAKSGYPVPLQLGGLPL